MGRFSLIAAVMSLALVPSLTSAGEIVEWDGGVVPIGVYPGGVNPLARGALYNTPPDVSFARLGYGHQRSRRTVLRVRY